MAKLLVAHDTDPGIAVIFAEVPAGTPGKAMGWYGTCTECGPDWVMHRWHQEKAMADAERHIDVTHGLRRTEVARLHGGERATTGEQQQERKIG